MVLRLPQPSVVTKALVVETEAKTETAGFVTKAEAVASEAEAVYLETEAQGSLSYIVSCSL